MNNQDYIVIGSIGFAQVGSGDFFAKEKVERQVIQEIVTKNEIFKIPERLSSIARLKYKGFPHDFGTYYELCVIYKVDPIDDNEDLAEKFWDWVNEMECFDFETEEIMARCRELYGKNVEMTVIPGGKSYGKKENPGGLQAM